MKFSYLLKHGKSDLETAQILNQHGVEGYHCKHFHYFPETNECVMLLEKRSYEEGDSFAPLKPDAASRSFEAEKLPWKQTRNPDIDYVFEDEAPGIAQAIQNGKGARDPNYDYWSKQGDDGKTRIFRGPKKEVL